MTEVAIAAGLTAWLIYSVVSVRRRSKRDKQVIAEVMAEMEKLRKARQSK